MIMPKRNSDKPYAYGRNGEITKEKYDAMSKELGAAMDRHDTETVLRLAKVFPVDADILLFFATVMGKDFIRFGDFDLTQANMAYGEGWLDKLED